MVVTTRTKKCAFTADVQQKTHKGSNKHRNFNAHYVVFILFKGFFSAVSIFKLQPVLFVTNYGGTATILLKGTFFIILGEWGWIPDE